MEGDNGTYRYDILGESYPLPHVDDKENRTKEDILVNSTIFFARRGYSTVSMREIANSVGIKPASLYNHFESKESLWQAVLSHTKDLYLLYFRHLGETLDRAESFEEVVDTIFFEPKRMANIFTCYAFSMIKAEQFRDESAAAIFNDTFLRYSIDFLRGWLQKCIDRGWAGEFDAGAVATIIIHTVLMGLDIKVQECLKRDIPYEPIEMFEDLHRLLLRIAELPRERN